jgi:lipopolysaccharide transport system ATP-binding protein
MSDIAISAQGIGKTYLIGHRPNQRYVALRDVIADKAKSLWTKANVGQSQIWSKTKEEFWALKDISFDIKQGEKVGIIGRNGAGKSTLLKILSRITEPTAGRAVIRGRVASLLEVGTGFHPELTGRENIFLNGTILGMTRQEIRRKFDEIVDFAGVEKFLDTPVKYFSSGMYVRLAFSVAAHLEPEILVIDEVLAVGDAQFQKKCLGKMEEIGNEGRTVLFVSHNMGAIRGLSNEAILLSNGMIAAYGQVEKVIEQYISANEVKQSGKIDLTNCPRNSVYSPMKSITEAWIETYEGKISYDLFAGVPFRVCFNFKAPRKIMDPMVGITIKNMYGEIVTYVNSRHIKKFFSDTDAGTARFDLGIVPLIPGKYSLTVQLYENVESYVDILVDAFYFTVLSSNLVNYTGGVFYIQPDDIAILN